MNALHQGYLIYIKVIHLHSHTAREHLRERISVGNRMKRDSRRLPEKVPTVHVGCVCGQRSNRDKKRPNDDE